MKANHNQPLLVQTMMYTISNISKILNESKSQLSKYVSKNEITISNISKILNESKSQLPEHFNDSERTISNISKILNESKSQLVRQN